MKFPPLPSRGAIVALSLLTAAANPPATAGDPAERTTDWRPAPGTLVLPVSSSSSPDGRYAVGWGYEKGPVDWNRLAFLEGEGSEWGAVTFSTYLADLPNGDPLEDDANFLIDLKTGETLCRLGIYYPGERPRYNHKDLVAVWSPGSACVAVIANAKWESESAAIAWIREGKCEGSYDILDPLVAAARTALRQSSHPAAKKLADGFEFSFTIGEIEVQDDGSFVAAVTGELPRVEDAGAFFEVRVEGALLPGGTEEEAILKTTSIRVKSPEE